MWRLLAFVLLLTTSASADTPPVRGADVVGLAQQVTATGSDFRALLIAILALMLLIVVPLITLLGYLVVRFTNASTATAAAMAANNMTLARMESMLGMALGKPQ